MRTSEVAQRFAKLKDAPKRGLKAANVRYSGPEDFAQAVLWSYETMIGLKVQEGYLVNPNYYSFSTSTHVRYLTSTLRSDGYVNVGTDHAYEVRDHGEYYAPDSKRFHLYTKDPEGRGKPIKAHGGEADLVDWPMRSDNTDWNLANPALAIDLEKVTTYGQESEYLGTKLKYDFSDAMEVYRDSHDGMFWPEAREACTAVYIRIPATVNAKMFSEYINSGMWEEVFTKLYLGFDIVSKGSGRAFAINAAGRRAVKMLEKRFSDPWMTITDGFRPDYIQVDAADIVKDATWSGKDRIIDVEFVRYGQTNTEEVVIKGAAGSSPMAKAMSFSGYMLREHKVIVTNALKAIHE